MNSYYRTPCNPTDCTNYTLDGCKVKCERFVKYIAIKAAMQHEKEMRGMSFEQRAKGTDDFGKQITVIVTEESIMEFAVDEIKTLKKEVADLEFTIKTMLKVGQK